MSFKSTSCCRSMRSFMYLMHSHSHSHKRMHVLFFFHSLLYISTFFQLFFYWPRISLPLFCKFAFAYFSMEFFSSENCLLRGSQARACVCVCANAFQIIRRGSMNLDSMSIRLYLMYIQMLSSLNAQLPRFTFLITYSCEIRSIGF